MADFTDIIQEINTNLPDNNTQSITAEKLRDTLIDLTTAIETQQGDFESDLVVDSLKSTETTKALSANNGYELSKRDTMVANLEKYMPEGITWTKPDGGLFLLITLPEGYDSKELFEIAIKQNVAFVIGEAFFCDGTGKNTLRVNFSFMDDAGIEEGIKRLSVAVRELLAKKA
jgi:DNA-binding transcriptional MocR family regulator